MSEIAPIVSEPEGDWQRADISLPSVPAGEYLPLEPLDTQAAKGRRRDPLEFVSVNAYGSHTIPQTFFLQTNAAGQLADAAGNARDPLPIVVRSGNVVARAIRLIGSQTSPILGVLLGTDPNPGMGNAALITPGDAPQIFTDGDLYISAANLPNIVSVNLSGYLVVVNYVYDPGFLQGR